MSLEKRILELIGEKGEATLTDLYADLPEYPKHSVRSKASILVKKGLLRKVGKGVYALVEGAAKDARPAAEDTPSEPATEASEEAPSAEDTMNVAEKDDVLTKTTSRDDLRKRVLRILHRQPDATPEELAEVLSASADTIRRIVAELIDQGELELPSERGTDTPREEKNIRGVKCFYATICHTIPGMRRVCEARGSLLCEQQKTTRPAAATP